MAGTPQWATPAKAIAKLASGAGFQNHGTHEILAVADAPVRAVCRLLCVKIHYGVADWIEFWSTLHRRWVPHQPKPDRGFVPPTKTSLQLNHSSLGVFSIHATSWERTASAAGGGSHFPLAWDFDNTSVAGVDHTTCYLTPPYVPPTALMNG